MPRCENFGPWTAVEGKMLEENGNKGHVLKRRANGTSDRIKSFPTYAEAKAWAEERYRKYLSSVLGRGIRFGPDEI